MGILVEYDTYLRTCNILAAVKSDISVSQRTAGRLYKHRYCIRLGTASKPTKNYSHGHAVEIGDLRPWLSASIPLMLGKLPSWRLWPYCHSKWAEMFSVSAAEFDLPFLVGPHMFRHSAASCDAFSQQRGAEGIRRRGFWAYMKSVQIYERHAALLRSVEFVWLIRALYALVFSIYLWKRRLGCTQFETIWDNLIESDGCLPPVKKLMLEIIKIIKVLENLENS